MEWCATAIRWSIARQMCSFWSCAGQGPFLFQKVLLRDANGAPHVLEYNMIDTEQGWRIDGVQLLSAPSIGA